jgi:DNA polymerase III alpha subunit
MTNHLSAGDVDIDFADRNAALALLEHTPASILRDRAIVKHNTGVYFHVVPVDPVTNLCSLNYEAAEEQGLYKVDLLNVHVYEQIKSEEHLLNLMNAPIDWSLFEYPEFTSQLIHLGNHSELVATLRPSSVSEIAMILALIRPGKRHLIDHCKKHGFSAIKDDIWSVSDNGYAFHKSHATSYAVLVKVHANLLVEQLRKSIDIPV